MAVHLARSGGRVFDLADLEYFSSAGIRSVLTARRRWGGRGKGLVSSLQPQIRKVFDIVKAVRPDVLADAGRGRGTTGHLLVGAAVANATYDTTGVRVREYPITTLEAVGTLPAVG